MNKVIKNSWESVIEETLWDPELCYQKIQEGLAYYPKHLQRVEEALFYAILILCLDL